MALKVAQKALLADKPLLRWREFNCGGAKVHGTSLCVETDEGNRTCVCPTKPPINFELNNQLLVQVHKEKTYLVTQGTTKAWTAFSCKWNSLNPNNKAVAGPACKERVEACLREVQASQGHAQPNGDVVERHVEPTPYQTLALSIVKAIEEQEAAAILTKKDKEEAKRTKIHFEAKYLGDPVGGVPKRDRDDVEEAADNGVRVLQPNHRLAIWVKESSLLLKCLPKKCRRRLVSQIRLMTCSVH